MFQILSQTLHKLFGFARDKFGRLITALGVFLQGIETFDITPVKGPLEDLIGHKWAQVIVIGCFVASYLRHQYVASQHPK